MCKQFPAQRGLKRQKKPEKIDKSGRRGRKNQRIEHKKVVRSPSPSSSGEFSAEESDDIVAEQVVYKEPSTYDSLLKTLGSTRKSLAHAYEKRQRQAEGKSDSEEEETDGSESSSVSEYDQDGEKDSDEESPGISVMESGLQEPRIVNAEEQRNDVEETEDDSEASYTDEEHDLGVRGQSAIQASAFTSSFDNHLDYKLSNEEVNDMSKKKWKYNWQVPAIDMLNCKWIGTGECFLKDDNCHPNHDLKPKLYKHWLDIYKTSGGSDFYSSKQRWFFSLCNSYCDILHSNKKPFYLKGLEEDSTTMDAYLIHCLNHIFRTRDRVKKNNAKLARHQETAEEKVLIDDGFLDQGFTRPKILILLPLRGIAFRVVKRLIALTPEAYKVNVEHIDRFSNEFGTRQNERDEGKNGLSENPHDIGNSKSFSKPHDFHALFGMNRDAEDNLMMGIKFTRRSIKLFSNFYSSDIIVASPVRLLNEIQKAKENKESDVDYLSSIEVLIIDHADIISMQNWSFLNSVVEEVNRIPSKQHGTDVMRVRHCYLDGHARFYRQTIILGHYSNPDINSFFSHHCVNYQGKVKLVSKYTGVLQKVLLQVQQIYERFNAESISDIDDARLEYFTKKVFPKIKDSIQGGILLFISSYFEFVRLRNFLKSQNASFCLIGDYAKPSDISRSRERFFKGTSKIMLYTERFHFNYRYKIRGIQNVIFYSLPERKEFYPEIVNMLEGSHNMTCTVLFSRFDQLRLQRIVGSSPAKRMVKSEKGIFVFC
ncbi:DUF1253 domain-containing protein [Cephalotus follicularis]|uniref:DUF1253 domain-containing protein n=1 Tax=Cephalotus follicularis TaxID=3775 RepID=A0A1Q3C6W9_CEPFO|nr:DUF1253 domain-containing protein [Cephalotus follicularis]